MKYALALTACVALGAAATERRAKVDPIATVHIDNESLRDYNGYQMRLSWQRGFLVAGSSADFPSVHDQVTLFDSAGKLVRKYNVLFYPNPSGPISAQPPCSTTRAASPSPSTLTLPISPILPP